MEESNLYTPEKLVLLNYRHLQQIAKGLELPANFKKFQLISMILAKKSYTPKILENIIRNMTKERVQLSQAKKNTKKPKRTQLQNNDDGHLCVTEVSAPSTVQSPPTTVTPKRPISDCHYSRPKPQKIQCKSKQTVLNQNKTLIRKSFKAPTRCILMNRALCKAKSNFGIKNSVVSVFKTQNSMGNNETGINISSQDGGLRLNRTARAVTHNLPASKIQAGAFQSPRPGRASSNMLSFKQPTLNPPNRQRAISEEQNTDITFQDNIDSNVPQSLLTDEYYDNHENDTHDNDNHDQDYERSSVYNHKKVRPEQVKSSQKDWALPDIHDAFSEFSYGQPIHVQASKESERIHNYPLDMGNQNDTSLMESLSDFVKQFILNEPLVQVANTSDTPCDFSSPTISTPNQPTHTVDYSEYYTLCERDSQSVCSTDIETPRINDSSSSEQNRIFLRDFNFNEACEGDSQHGFYMDVDTPPILNDYTLSSDQALHFNEVMNTSSSSLGTGLDQSQELVAEDTTPRIDDVLEIISHDGDNMETIDMDGTTRCMLCSWAGSRVILEYHVRQNHTNMIESPKTNKCTITYTVGRLLQKRMLRHVIQYDSVLYVLSAKYEDPGGFIMFNISMISQDTITPKNAKITLYSKVTGEPFSWQGKVNQISASMWYDTNSLRVAVKSLDLLPNITNMKLWNQQLVIKSPGEVIVGKPELDDIHIAAPLMAMCAREWWSVRTQAHQLILYLPPKYDQLPGAYQKRGHVLS